MFAVTPVAPSVVTVRLSDSPIYKTTSSTSNVELALVIFTVPSLTNNLAIPSYAAVT